MWWYFIFLFVYNFYDLTYRKIMIHDMRQSNWLVWLNLAENLDSQNHQVIELACHLEIWVRDTSPSSNRQTFPILLYSFWLEWEILFWYLDNYFDIHLIWNLSRNQNHQYGKFLSYHHIVNFGNLYPHSNFEMLLWMNESSHSDILLWQKISRNDLCPLIIFGNDNIAT